MHTESKPQQPLKTHRTYYPAVIIGAGESGIAVGCLLKKKLGLSDFRIFERQSGIGGVWWINRYPGVACDIPGLLYSYSFAPNYEWSSLFPPGDEIQRYLENVCETEDIRRNIQLNTEVSKARWIEREAEWEIDLVNLAPFVGKTNGENSPTSITWNEKGQALGSRFTVRSKILVTCAGELVEPNPWPQQVSGRDIFKGPIFHSARWNKDIDLRDKNVLVIGTGCTSAQLVPSLVRGAGAAKSVTQLMRSPPWILSRPKTPALWKKYSSSVFQALPLLALLLRYILFLYAETTWFFIGMRPLNNWLRSRFERGLLAKIRNRVPEKYWHMLAPTFGVGCRRLIVDDDWLDSLNRSNVELTTRPLLAVNETSVTLGIDPSTRAISQQKTITRPTDVIVLANGFDTSTYLHRLPIHGRNGQKLQDVWDKRGGPSAYLSTAIHGFPNFFMILGPNAISGHSSAILASENVASYVLRLVAPILSEDATTVEIQAHAEETYTADVQRRSRDKVWQTCRNGYIAPNGWNSSICPFNQIHFSLKCMFPRWEHWAISYTDHKHPKHDWWGFAYAWIMATLLMLAVICILPRQRHW